MLVPEVNAEDFFVTAIPFQSHLFSHLMPGGYMLVKEMEEERGEAQDLQKHTAKLSECFKVWRAVAFALDGFESPRHKAHELKFQ